MSKPVFLVYIDAKLLHLTYVIIQYKKYIIRKWISSRKATDSIPKKKKTHKNTKKTMYRQPHFIALHFTVLQILVWLCFFLTN